MVGLNMLKEGKGDAFVSAGSTGALHVGASLIVRTLKGVKRPAWPPWCRPKTRLSAAGLRRECGVPPRDAGAFAVMGSCYVNKVEGRRPQRGAGQQRCRGEQGHPDAQEAHQLLKTTPGIRFVGNIEPRDVPTAKWTWWSATALPATSSSS